MIMNREWDTTISSTSIDKRGLGLASLMKQTNQNHFNLIHLLTEPVRRTNLIR